MCRGESDCRYGVLPMRRVAGDVGVGGAGSGRVSGSGTSSRLQVALGAVNSRVNLGA